MIATWMLYATVIAILAAVAALALERGARMLGVAGRWCWVGAMALSLALPIAAWVRPQVLPPAAIRIPTPNGTVEATPPVTITAPAITTHPRPAWTWDDLDRPLMVGWGFMTLALVAWFGVGSWRLARLRRSWRSEGSLLISDNVGPAVVGFLRCHVVVPEWSLELGADQRELLLAHEAEHLATHDSRLLLLSAVVLALVPWNVGLWWQFRCLRLAIELDCDQRVLRKRPDPATYGRLLLDVGTRVTRTLMPVTAFYEPMSALERRIRSLTARRPRGAGILALTMSLGGTAAIFLACEAPRPTGPARKEPFSYQIKQEDGRIQSTYIADSVRSYFPRLPLTADGSAYVWFVLSPDLRVIRHGTTPRNPADHVIRSAAVDSVIPDFDYTKTMSVTIVGENAMWPGSQPVYWAVLRDPSKPATWLPPEVDSLALLPWVREGLEKYWSNLMAEKSGEPVSLWFFADAKHHILSTSARPPVVDRGLAGLEQAQTQLGGNAAQPVANGVMIGTAHGWARSNVTIVWVTLRDGISPGALEEVLNRLGSEAEHNAEPNEAEHREAERVGGGPSDQIRYQEAVRREGGMKVVAERYPQWVSRPANPPVTIWVVEGHGGKILSTHTSKRYTELGSPEMLTELPAYAQLREGEWFGYFPLNEQRQDVWIVWMHSNRGQ